MDTRGPRNRITSPVEMRGFYLGCMNFDQSPLDHHCTAFTDHRSTQTSKSWKNSATRAAKSIRGRLTPLFEGHGRRCISSVYSSIRGSGGNAKVRGVPARGHGGAPLAPPAGSGGRPGRQRILEWILCILEGFLRNFIRRKSQFIII